MRYLERALTPCHASNVPLVEAEIAAARRGEGPTLFDLIVVIIRSHGPGGTEAEDGVWLELDCESGKTLMRTRECRNLLRPVSEYNSRR